MNPCEATHQKIYTLAFLKWFIALATVVHRKPIVGFGTMTIHNFKPGINTSVLPQYQALTALSEQHNNINKQETKKRQTE